MGGLTTGWWGCLPSHLLYLRASTGASPLHTLLVFERAYPFCAFELAVAICTPLVAKLPSHVSRLTEGRLGGVA